MIRYSFFGYALASAIIMIICGIAYQIFFSSKVRPSINRTILLTILGLGMAIPLFSLIFISSPREDDQSIVVGTPMIANIYVDSTPSNVFSTAIKTLIPILNYIYIGGIIVMSIIAGISLYRLFKLKKDAERASIFGIKIYVHDNSSLATFSWINNIFVYKNASREDLYALLTHELAHVRLCHWVDIILAQTILIFQWFNPVVWLLKRELQEVHEYQADNHVIETGINKTDYQMLLVRNVSKGRMPVMVAGIKSCSLKKRLLMMKRTNFKSNWMLRSSSLFVALFCGIILLQMPAVAEVVETKEPVLKENVTVINKDEDENIIYSIDNVEVSYDEIRKLDSSKIAWIEVFKDDQNVIGIVTKEFNEQDPIRIRNKEDKTEFIPVSDYVRTSSIVPERSPSYKGGIEKLKEDLRIYIKYYKYSSDDRKEGTVEVAFTVTSKGELDKFRIVRSLDSEYDITAVQALKSLNGEWTPGTYKGKSVDIEMVVPIYFVK